MPEAVRRRWTIAETAEIDFQAWPHKRDKWTPPTAEELRRLVPNLRIAWLLMFKSRAELEEMLVGVDTAVALDLFDRLAELSDAFAAFADIRACTYKLGGVM
jgi:hypothetical protein